ncbi:hypothetical protein C8J56DRAFT_958517 [Mycena floridula]|nr:hypothetical protein C8J56DRAFT_958508 [Mycena floridula]KAJ7581916.1 hypothetical protein C8J56DRAFT_958517 [Mycena floridula]
MLSFTKVSVLVAVFFAALGVNADIIAWSGDACNGAEGLNVACNGGCIAFDGRHSFEVVSGRNECVVLFEGDGCTGEAFNFGSEVSGQCINVNTGTPIGSFSCSPC